MDLPAYSRSVPGSDCVQTLGSAVLEYHTWVKSKEYPRIEEMV
jgi:hypothetical protein